MKWYENRRVYHWEGFQTKNGGGVKTLFDEYTPLGP